jgi:enoyl-[acyl-carrier protein] reductase I
MEFSVASKEYSAAPSLYDELIAAAAATAPSHHLVDVDVVGALAAFLVSDGARHITGTIIPVDGGQHLS